MRAGWRTPVLFGGRGPVYWAYSMAMERRLQIAIDCSDPTRLAAFWAEVLSYTPVDPPSGHESWAEFSASEAHEPGEQWMMIADPDGKGPTVLFHRVPEAKIGKNRLHLDVWPPRSDAEADVRKVVETKVAQLVQLGATRLRTRDDDGEFYVVMQDPEGNEFCVA